MSIPAARLGEGFNHDTETPTDQTFSEGDRNASVHLTDLD
jgi:hypothetical protein